MTEIKFSAKAYCKIILHAVKYPHCSVNGLLLAKSSSLTNKEVEFIDAVPLFHICINLTAMAEIALMQIDEFASTRGLIVAGYYTAQENLRDNTFEKAYHRIAEKIAVYSSPSYLVVVNNMHLGLNEIPLKVAQNVDGNYKACDPKNVFVKPENALDICSTLLHKQAYKVLVDFDNHLDDISLDWMNSKLNKEIEDLL